MKSIGWPNSTAYGHSADDDLFMFHPVTIKYENYTKISKFLEDLFEFNFSIAFPL